MDGGSLIARGAITVVGNTVKAGALSGSGTDGSAFGAGPGGGFGLGAIQHGQCDQHRGADLRRYG